MKSKISFALPALYLLSTGVIIIYGLFCSEQYCGMSLALPIMPWQLLLEGIVELNLQLYVILVLVNVALLYFLGRAISQFIARISKVS